MPILLGLSCAVLLLLTLVFVFIEFGEKSCCCGQYTFLAFFNLFIIAPVVTWTAMVVFPLGIPDEVPNQFSPYTMGWLRIGGIRYDNQYSKLNCDPVFWKGTFWFVCLFCAFEVGIIVAIFLKVCKVTCRGLKKCCCCCCENEKSDPEHHQNYALSEIITSENAENTLLVENNQETENLPSNNQEQEPQSESLKPIKNKKINSASKTNSKEDKKNIPFVKENGKHLVPTNNQVQESQTSSVNESVLKYENLTALEEENQNIPSPPPLFSQISIPLD